MSTTEVISLVVLDGYFNSLVRFKRRRKQTETNTNEQQSDDDDDENTSREY